MIIDSSYFIEETTLQIAQLSEKSVEEKLDRFINQYEPEYLVKALGYELSQSFVNGLGEEKFDGILSGVEFSQYGSYYRYGGIKQDIARYVYWHYEYDMINQNAGIGTVKTKGQGSVNVSPMPKMLKAWNEMAESTKVLWKYLNYNRSLGSYYWPIHNNWLSLTQHQNIYGV